MVQSAVLRSPVVRLLSVCCPSVCDVGGLCASAVSLERSKPYARPYTYSTRWRVGGGTSLVCRLTLATLSAKNWLKASTSTAELAGTQSQPTQQDVDEVASGPTIRLVSFNLVAPKLCAFSLCATAISVELTQTTWPPPTATIIQRHRRTDGRTDLLSLQ